MYLASVVRPRDQASSALHLMAKTCDCLIIVLQSVSFVFAARFAQCFLRFGSVNDMTAQSAHLVSCRWRNGHTRIERSTQFVYYVRLMPYAFAILIETIRVPVRELPCMATFVVNCHLRAHLS